jgi:hypothetical protein
VMFDSALFHKTDDFRFKKVRAPNHKSEHQNENAPLPNAPLPSTLAFEPPTAYLQLNGSRVQGVGCWV